MFDMRRRDFITPVTQLGEPAGPGDALYPNTMHPERDQRAVCDLRR